MSYPNKKNLTKMVHVKAGYKTTVTDANMMRGVIYINFAEEGPR